MYTFKDSEYSTEDEYRMLSLRNYNEALLDENNKLYVESPDFLFQHQGYEIFIGPKHDDPVKTRLELEYRISKLNLSDKIKVTISQIQYR
jgi:hypothetical protein